MNDLPPCPVGESEAVPILDELPVTVAESDESLFQGAICLIAVGILAYFGLSSWAGSLFQPGFSPNSSPHFWFFLAASAAHGALFVMGLSALRRMEGNVATRFAVGVFGLFVLVMLAASFLPSSHFKAIP